VEGKEFIENFGGEKRLLLTRRMRLEDNIKTYLKDVVYEGESG
jgi:hypothetical protein